MTELKGLTKEEIEECIVKPDSSTKVGEMQ